MTWLGLPVEIWGAVATVIAAIIGVLGAWLIRAKPQSAYDLVQQGHKLKFLEGLVEAVVRDDGDALADSSRLNALIQGFQSNRNLFNRGLRATVDRTVKFLRSSRSKRRARSDSAFHVLVSCVREQRVLTENEINAARGDSIRTAL